MLPLVCADKQGELYYVCRAVMKTSSISVAFKNVNLSIFYTIYFKKATHD